MLVVQLREVSLGEVVPRAGRMVLKPPQTDRRNQLAMVPFHEVYPERLDPS